MPCTGAPWSGLTAIVETPPSVLVDLSEVLNQTLLGTYLALQEREMAQKRADPSTGIASCSKAFRLSWGKCAKGCDNLRRPRRGEPALLGFENPFEHVDA